MEVSTKRIRDEFLALRCQSGEPGAFADLVQRFERPLLYYAAKFVGDENLALDVLQEAWCVAVRKIGGLQNPSSLRPWLYCIVRGAAIDRVRRDHARLRAEAAVGPAAAVGEAEEVFDAEDAAALHASLDAIDVKHREVLVLHFLNDLSIAEIAEVVGEVVGTVKSRLHYAKRSLRRELERRGCERG